jgi:hypothetical protein
MLHFAAESSARSLLVYAHNQTAMPHVPLAADDPQHEPAGAEPAALRVSACLGRPLVTTGPEVWTRPWASSAASWQRGEAPGNGRSDDRVPARQIDF